MKRLSILLIALLLVGCVAGPIGPQGPQGAPGAQGRPGDPAPTLDANLVAAQVLAMLPTPEPAAAAEWQNWSRRFALLTDDGGATPVKLGTDGSMMVKGYATARLVTVEVVIVIGGAPVFPGKGAFVVQPTDPALQETVVVSNNRVISLSAIGSCMVYRGAKGDKMVGLANMEQLPGDPSLPENKGLVCYLPKNDGGAFGTGAYRVKASNGPWGTAWAPGDTLTFQITYEVP